MLKQYSHFVIIYNPNSTGNAPLLARNAALSLSELYDKKRVLLMPTEYAGHAIDIAKKAAAHYETPLIISVSGDGGYNEVVNGVRAAVDAGSAKSPTVTVIGAGNANDHYRVVHERRPIEETIKSNPRPIDLLKVTIESANGKKKTCQYAHSYVGVGITPRVAEELNRYKLNFLKEAKIIISTLIALRPLKIEVDGVGRQVDSLVFANISQMAKVLTLTDDNSLHDGQFEVVEISHTNIFGLLLTLLRAATVGLKQQPKRTSFSFTALEDHPVQFDGEIVQCRTGDKICVTVAKDAVQSLI